MPYFNTSGAVATVSAGPVSYKMPVPSSSRYSTSVGASGTYRAGSSLSSSLDRPFYSSSTGSYITPSSTRTSARTSTYTSEYRSKYTSPSRTTSLGSYTRQSSVSDDSGISSLSSSVAGRYSSNSSGTGSTSAASSTSSSRERSESREASSGVVSSRSRDSSALGRRCSSSSSVLSASELYSKYSPSNYVSGSGDLGRPPRPSYLTDTSDSSTSTYTRSRSTTVAEKSNLTTPSSRLASRSSTGGGAVGGCSTTTPISERRSRSSGNNEVILHFNNGATVTASNNNNDESSLEDDDNDESSLEDDDNDDDNGNEPKVSVAEIRRRFDGAGSVSVSATLTAPPAAAGSNSASAVVSVQNGASVRRRVRDPSSSGVVVPRSSPSPVPVRKVYVNAEVVCSDEEEEEDEDDDEEEDEDSGNGEEVKEMTSRRVRHSEPSSSGVAGGATDGSPRYSRPHASSGGSPKATAKFHQSYSYRDGSDVSLLTSSPRISRLNTRNSGNERGGLAGLRNIGNTCFMNSVIQCLSNTKQLLEYLLADSYLSDLNVSVSSMKGALIKAFSTVIQELWRNESDGMVVNTTALKSQIQRFAPRFMGYSQQDAQEFLRYLLEGLHEDVNRVTCKPKPILTEIDDTLSDSQKAVESWKRYLRMDDSKIVDIFVGQLKSTLQCTSCGHCSVTFDPFWDLSLPIPSRTGQLRLQQCFDHFTREEVLDGDEKPTCAKCQMRRKCTKSFTIQKFPKILVLHLKRFSPTERFRGKLNVTVDFPLNGLDLSAYAANRGQGSMYNLYGVANHSGTTYSGHYTAYCKHPYTGDWHEYNDSRVSSISTRTVVSNEAYVLFYELSGHSSHL